jgi:polysaccharide biosynthesis/export protein
MLEHAEAATLRVNEPLMIAAGNMRRLLVAFCLVAGLCLGACAQRQNGYADFKADVPYTLASGDRLRVIVFGQDALSNTYAVNSSGRISMPLIGSVVAQGLTTPALERSVEEKLRAGFIREPKVSIEVDAYRPFFVLGEVTTAGQYPYIAGMTAETAIAVAGGFTARANKYEVDLTRVVDGHPVTASVPVSQPVSPGDTIFVRERFF